MTFVAIPDKNAGDIVTEAMWDAIKDDVNSGVWRPLAETRLSADTASIDIQNIPGTHAGLFIAIHARQTAASSETPLLRFNNDSGANYDWQRQNASATTRAGSESFGATSIFPGNITDSGSPTGAFAQILIWLPSYANSTTHKACVIQNTRRALATSGGTGLSQHSGVWRSTAAITRVTLSISSGNVLSGSRVTVYGTGAGV